MNKWEKLLDALTHLREGLDIVDELYHHDLEVRALLSNRIPLLTAGGMAIVSNALVKLTDETMKLRDRVRPHA